MKFYVLRGREIVEIGMDEYFKNPQALGGSLSQQLAFTKFKNREITVSTVFLSIGMPNHNGMVNNFETMVFGGEMDGQTLRYGNLDAAIAGHREVVLDVVKAESNKIKDFNGDDPQP